MADPKLKEAMAEVKAILKKYDIGGHVSLVSEKGSEFLFELEPSWSCVTLDEKGDGSAEIRFRSREQDFKSKQEQQRVTEESVWLLLAIRDLAAQAFGLMESIEKKLLKHMEIDHQPFAGFEPHKKH